METALKRIQKEISKLEKMLETINRFQRNEPEGNLKIQMKQNRSYFYHQYKEMDENKWNTRYIKKKDFDLAFNLAQKQYYALVKPILMNNLKALKRFVKDYHLLDYREIYECMPETKKQLVVPLYDRREEILKKWKSEVYKPNNYFAENLRYETEQGEMVKSKSEVIIANMLYKHKDELLYKYERPLEVEVDGYKKIIYPDFTALNVRTGRITYWEHAGCMDDSSYVNDFVKKEKIYIQNNIFPGKDVIFTYETQERPLDIGVVRKIVSLLLD